MLLADPGSAGIGPGRGEVAILVGLLAMAGEIILIGMFAGRIESDAPSPEHPLLTAANPASVVLVRNALVPWIFDSQPGRTGTIFRIDSYGFIGLTYLSLVRVALLKAIPLQGKGFAKKG